MLWMDGPSNGDRLTRNKRGRGRVGTGVRDRVHPDVDVVFRQMIAKGSVSRLVRFPAWKQS